IERLRKLADAAANKYPETSAFLAREIERAAVLPGATPCAGLVTMDSTVTFRDDGTSQTRSARLGYPEDADVDAGEISVLAPRGAARIGRSDGQTLELQAPAGGWRALTVLTVKPQAACPPNASAMPGVCLAWRARAHPSAPENCLTSVT